MAVLILDRFKGEVFAALPGVVTTLLADSEEDEGFDALLAVPGDFALEDRRLRESGTATGPLVLGFLSAVPSTFPTGRVVGFFGATAAAFCSWDSFSFSA